MRSNSKSRTLRRLFKTEKSLMTELKEDAPEAVDAFVPAAIERCWRSFPGQGMFVGLRRDAGGSRSYWDKTSETESGLVPIPWTGSSANPTFLSNSTGLRLADGRVSVPRSRTWRMASILNSRLGWSCSRAR